MSRRTQRRVRRVDRSHRKTARAIATAAAMAGGTQAYADAVRFENNGEFEWSRCRDTIRLDILLPAGAQDGALGPARIDLSTTCESCGYYSTMKLRAPDGAFVRRSDGGCYYYCSSPPPRPMKMPEGAWIQRDLRGAKGWRPGAVDFYCGCCNENHWPPGAGYMGFRFTAADGIHYGWVYADRVSRDGGPHLDALAWGYETEPDAPIKAGEGAAPCRDGTRFKVACKSGRSGPFIKASIKKTTPGLFTALRLDGDPNLDQRIQASTRGKAKATFKKIGPGEHTVELLQCGLAETVECTPIDPPANDLCADAIPLAVPSEVAGSTRAASIDEGFPACGQGTEVIAPGVWYQVIGTGRWMQADTCAGADFNTKINVYEEGCNEPVCVVGNNNSCGDLSAVAWQSVEGRFYWILIHATRNESGEFTLNVSDSDGEINCERVDALELMCVQESSGITAVLETTLPEGTLLQVTLDGNVTREARVGSRGRAEVVFENVAPGVHEVCVDECPEVCQSVECS